MAEIISQKFLKSTTILATTTSARPSDLIPANCHTVVIYNPDSTNDVYVAIADAGDVLDPTGGGDVIPIVVKAGASLNLGMGTISLRPQSQPVEADQLVYQTSTGSIQVNISYICTIEF